MTRDQRSLRLAVAFAREVVRSPGAALCVACVDALEVAGAGITLMGGTAGGPICVSGRGIAALEDMQYTTGQGPCQDAFQTGVSVHAPDLDLADAGRWPSFVGLARASGIGAVFAYPLSTTGARIGVLTLYRHEGGDLSARQHDDSLAMAEILTETVLSVQEAESFGTLAAGLDGVVASRAQIHQAAGMVSAQLEIPVAEAMARIRAHAFAIERSVELVAADVVARRLRLDDDHADDPGGIDR